MNIRNLIVGLSILVAAQAAAFGASYSCTTSTGVSLTYTEVAGPTVPPVVVAPPVIGTDPGSGLWIPEGMDNRTVADISGPPGYVVSYIPGCLNGLVSNNSYSGCAANSSYSGTLTGTNGWSRTVRFGSGKEVMLRYKPKANAGTTAKMIRLRSASGSSSSLGVSNVRMWLSTDPTSTYDNTPNACKQTSSTSPYIITGPGYCQISASNPVYYLGIAYDDPQSLRFQVDQSGSDFQ